MKRHWLARGSKIAVFAVIAIGAIGVVVMTLWNWLAPALFGGHAIGFWQALGLFALARLLVGGLRGHGGHRTHWRQRMIERWDSMSEDERAKVREAMQHRCGHRGRHIAPQAPAQPAA
ncbi:MAG: hypothetical protein ABI156_02325 [Caldimonas sp.]